MGRKKAKDDTARIREQKGTYALWAEYLKEKDEYRYRCHIEGEDHTEFLDRIILW